MPAGLLAVVAPPPAALLPPCWPPCRPNHAPLLPLRLGVAPPLPARRPLPRPTFLPTFCYASCRALEEAVYDEAGHEEECSKVHVVRALLRVNVDMPEKTAQQVGVRRRLGVCNKPHRGTVLAGWQAGGCAWRRSQRCA